MDINQLTEQYKSMEELKVFCGAQFKQILNLSKKIKELEEKNQELQKKVKENNNLSVLKPEFSNLNPTVDLKVKSDAETVAQVQIKMIKEQAFHRELTMEETKKLEIFNRILTQPEEKQKPIKADAKVLSENELLAAVVEESSVGSK